MIILILQLVFSCFTVFNFSLYLLSENCECPVIQTSECLILITISFVSKYYLEVFQHVSLKSGFTPYGKCLLSIYSKIIANSQQCHFTIKMLLLGLKFFNFFFYVTNLCRSLLNFLLQCLDPVIDTGINKCVPIFTHCRKTEGNCIHLGYLFLSNDQHPTQHSSLLIGNELLQLSKALL